MKPEVNLLCFTILSNPSYTEGKTHWHVYSIYIIVLTTTDINLAEFLHQISNSGAKALVTVPALLPVLLKVCAKVGIPKERIFLYGENDAQGIPSVYSLLADKPVAFPIKGINPKEDVAFVCYSSGTTGLAKGVMLTHRNFISQTMLSNAVGEKDKAEDDIVLGFLPFFHIFGECFNLIARLVVYNANRTMS